MTSKQADLKNRVADRATEVANRPRNLIDQINALVPQMSRVLMSDKKADRLARIAITEYKRNPKFAECDPATFFGSLMLAAQHDLEPGVLGLAYLIPYRGQVTLQLGYRGLLELVGRSDKVDSVYAYPVYEGDVFKFSLGAHPDVVHEPCGENDDDKLTHVYAVAHLKGSTIPRIEVMSRKQVDGIRRRSQSDQAAKKYDKQTPWDTDYAEMARKTVLKRLCKTLPMSIESQTAIASDEAVHRVNLQTMEASDSVSMYEIKGEEVNMQTGEVVEATPAAAPAKPAKAAVKPAPVEPETAPTGEPLFP